MIVSAIAFITHVLAAIALVAIVRFSRRNPGPAIGHADQTPMAGSRFLARIVSICTDRASAIAAAASFSLEPAAC